MSVFIIFLDFVFGIVFCGILFLCVYFVVDCNMICVFFVFFFNNASRFAEILEIYDKGLLFMMCVFLKLLLNLCILLKIIMIDYMLLSMSLFLWESLLRGFTSKSYRSDDFIFLYALRLFLFFVVDVNLWVYLLLCVMMMKLYVFNCFVLLFLFEVNVYFTTFSSSSRRIGCIVLIYCGWCMIL